MTVTPSPPRAARRRALAAAVVSAVLALSPLSALSASAATATPEPTDPASDASGSIDLTLAPVSSGILEPGDSLTVTMKLDNGTPNEIASSPVDLAIGTRPLSSRTALSSWLAGTAAAVATTELAGTTLSAAEPLTSSVRSLTVPASAVGLQDLEPGVYPLVATISTGDVDVSSTSAIVVPDPDADEVATTLVVPVTAGPRSTGLLSAADLTSLTAFDGALTAQLTAVRGTTAVLAIDPAIPASIRVLGNQAPASALEWLTELLALPNERFALQFGDADPGVQLAAGLAEPLAPRALTAYLNPEDFDGFIDGTQPTAIPTPEPTETDAAEAEETEADLPSLDELLSIGDSLTDVYWPATDSVTGDTVAALGALGSDGSALTIVSSRTTAAGSSGGVVAARSAAGEASVLVYDAESSAELSAAAAADEPIARSASVAAATAQLAFAAAGSSARPIAIALDRGALPTRTGASIVMTAIDDAPGIALTTLDELSASAERSVTIAQAEVDPVRVGDTERLRDGEADVARFATILEDRSLLTGPERAEILQLLGTAWTADPAAAHLAVTAHGAEVADTLDSVGLLPTSDITLAGSTASLRFWVRNDLPYPVDVVLLTSSDNLRLSVDSAIPVAATASSNTRVVVPVQARIGNGQVALELELRSPSGISIGTAQTVEVNVRAEWEGVGIAVLSVLVAGLVVIGAVRTVLRLRSRRRPADGEPDAAGAHAPEEADAADAGDPQASDAAPAGSAEDGPGGSG
ncbi:DUF6049 family protein [Microbacterium thalassium]|uniref:2-oxoglutarate dehydrogenase n=1 Tax=Microbacterium thalassium TaxID=362649 RepID=A0A7X0FNP4_9MICO|nr:DUF6049 family protein [Microbacterium thalassium]MBB6390311.1 hypothetical protein [Microbacterium thalassium]GLK25420.1 hypothetical protein GCM10017607_27390 [Microbacterium thalassium]